MHIHRAPTLALLLLSMLALGACRGPDAPPRPVPAVPAPAASPQAVTRIGDVSIHASVVQTSILDPAVASAYGISRDERRVLLLVAVRQGPDAAAVALPARVTATVTDLRGRRQELAMRELRSGELLDYLGTVEIDLPETLRFEVTVTRAGGATSTIQIDREFHPR